MKQRLELVEGNSSKFWQIAVSGNTHTVTFGKIGTSGRAQTKEFANADEAKRDADKLIAEKTRKGYHEVKTDGEASTASPPEKPATTKTKKAAPGGPSPEKWDEIFAKLEKGEGNCFDALVEDASDALQYFPLVAALSNAREDGCDGGGNIWHLAVSSESAELFEFRADHEDGTIFGAMYTQDELAKLDAETLDEEDAATKKAWKRSLKALSGAVAMTHTRWERATALVALLFEETNRIPQFGADACNVAEAEATFADSPGDILYWLALAVLDGHDEHARRLLERAKQSSRKLVRDAGVTFEATLAGAANRWSVRRNALTELKQKEHAKRQRAQDLLGNPAALAERFAKVRVLNASYRNISKISGAAAQRFSGARKFDVSNCKIAEIEPEFSVARGLEELDLTGHELKVLPPVLGELQNLKRLIAPGQISEICPEIGNLRKLEWLDLRGGSAETLPETIGNLTELKVLRLTSVREFPASFAHLTNLEEFVLERSWLNGNKIPLRQLKKLKRLHLNTVYHLRLDEEFNHLTALEEFKFSGLSIEPGDLARAFAPLENLRSLNVELTNVECTDLAELKALEELNISEMKHAEFAKTLARLDKLRHIKMTNCGDIPMSDLAVDSAEIHEFGGKTPVVLASPKLRHLKFFGYYSGAGLDDLLLAVPNLESLSIIACKMPEQERPYTFPNLRRLTLHDGPRQIYFPAPSWCPNLEELDVQKAYVKWDEASLWPKLRVLRLSEAQGPETFEYWPDLVEYYGHCADQVKALPALVNSCKKLRRLAFGWPVAPAGELLRIAELTDLEELTLNADFTKHGDELSDIIAALPQLRTLSLAYSKFDGLPLALTTLGKLEFFDLSCCGLSPEEEQLIRASLPDTEVKLSTRRP